MGKFGKFYFCEVCDLRQPNPASLVKHMREDHHCEEEFVARNPDLVHNFSEVCPSCGIRVINVAELLEHATLVHEFNGTVRQEVFQSFIEFEEWKERMEEENISTWVRRKHKTIGNVVTIHMKCHRVQRTTAHCQEESDLQRKTKVVGRSCTSYMNVERNLQTDITTVEYCLEHFGHEKDLLKQDLPWSVKMEIVDMLKQNLTASQIVNNLKEKYMADNEGGLCILKRQYWITTKDVRRVAAHFKLYPHKYERMEGISPEVLVKTEPDSPETSPEVLAKTEPDSSEASPEMFAKVEPDSSEASADVLFKTEPHSSEVNPEVFAKIEPDSSEANPEVLVKPEPDSSEASTAAEGPKEPSPEEVKALIDEALLQVFSKSKAAKTPPPSTEVKPKRPLLCESLLPVFIRALLGDPIARPYTLAPDDKVPAMVKFWFCEVCDLRQPNPASLIKHMRDEHQCGEEFLARNPNLVENAPELCPSCGICVLDVNELLAHVTLVHEFDGVVRREVFQSFAEFEQWKERMEDENISTWVKRKRPTKTAANVITMSLRCHRLKRQYWVNRTDVYRVGKDLRARPQKYGMTEDVSPEPVVKAEPDSSEASTAPEFFEPEPSASSSSILESFIERELSHTKCARPEEALVKADSDPAESSTEPKKRPKKEEARSAFSIAEVITGGEVGPTKNACPEEGPIKAGPDLAESSTVPKKRPKKEEARSAFSIAEVIPGGEVGPTKNACPEEEPLKADSDPAESSTEPKKRPKKEEARSAFSIAEVIPGGEVGPTKNACPEEEPLKAGPDPAESSSTVPKKRHKKEEPCSAFSIAEVIPGAELGPTASAIPNVHVKAESGPDSAESTSVAEKLFIKEEPISVTTLLPESSSTSMELSSEEAKPPTDEGVRVFSLALAPDGKGFALVDQSGNPQDIL
ncbi:unnamed protein product [Heligmosomoides polygyrus]|uniref:C2H2-type domain-containing protein n=1 Tax=Heligmosomoides polygyrus TaxID=6339 RepID=A0A3P7YEB9_HELPZ|nr:unnamed protein product [Heligmosomoides polygyrus]